jgi:lysophospholipase L1-like esterase
MRGNVDWLTVALIRAGTLASSTAVLAAVLATPVAAQPAEGTVDSPGTAESTQVEQRELKVEAFGDSYFTGLGAGHYNRPDARRQSGAAGFLQALGRLEATNPGVSVTVNNHSAAGATIDNLYETQMAGGLLGGNMAINAPQLEGVRPDADVAIMGFGGNDVGFVGAIVSTFGADTPLRNRVARTLAGQLNLTRPPADYLADAARPRGQQQTLVGELVRGIQEVRRAMPNAKVVVTTYPEAVDPSATSLLSVVSPAELAAFRELARALNAGIRQAAALTGATVADNAEAFSGHEVYTKDPYLHDLGPQWRKYDSDEAMHPNAAGQTVMSDAIADAIAKATGLNRAAPRTTTEPFPTDGLDFLPRRPSRPTRTLPETPVPDPINWTPNEPAAEGSPAEGARGEQSPGEGRPILRLPAAPQPPVTPGPAQQAAPAGQREPTRQKPPAENPEPAEQAPSAEEPSEPDGRPAVEGLPADQPPTQAPDPKPGLADNGAANLGGVGGGDSSGTSNPADGTGRGEGPDSSGKAGPADNAGNGGDRDQGTTDPGLGGGVGPADNPGDGGDRDQGTVDSGVSDGVGPADNPSNGGDRDEGSTSADSGAAMGPADNPGDGGDRDQGTVDSGVSGGIGPADNPSNGGDRDQGTVDSGVSGGSGPADNPSNGGDRDQGTVNSGVSGGIGPADNPSNGGDRDQGTADSSVSDGVGPADNPSNGGDRDEGSTSGDSGAAMGPADNPDNGGDRDSPSYGGDSGDPAAPVS